MHSPKSWVPPATPAEDDDEYVDTYAAQYADDDDEDESKSA